MSNENKSDTPKKGNKFKKFLLIIFLMAMSIAIIYGLSLLGVIHGKDLPEEYFSNGYPSILGLLDSEVFMGIIFFITLSVFAYIGYLLWELHEVAVHKAEADASAQVQLVFALSLCGLFINKAWWVLAIIIAFTSWKNIGEWLSNIIHNPPNTKKITEDNTLSNKESK